MQVLQYKLQVLETENVAPGFKGWSMSQVTKIETGANLIFK